MRIVRTHDGTRFEGVVLLRAGNPEASVHQGPEGQVRGRNALKRVWQDSYDDEATIELHARVDMEGLVAEYADAILERPAKVVKRAKVPQAIDRKEIETRLAAWREKGFDTSSVESQLEADSSVATAAYLALLEAVRKAEAVKDTLDALDTSGFESRAASLREKLKDPVRNPDIDAEVESLRDAIESHKRVEARRKLEVARERDSRERTKKVLELVLRQRETLRPEAAPPSKEEMAKALEGPPPTRDEATNLIDEYTFDAFVVGESNRFAHAAALAVAKQPGRAYNPLVVTSGPALGKTHLLHAVGNHIRAQQRNARVLYLSCEALASQAGGASRELRERTRAVDCLLLDDLQSLSGRSALQDDMLRAFEDLTAEGKQVVLACDRPPKAITDLDDRLVSRFESGLVANIQPPERETRIQVLRQRAQSRNLSVDADVLAYIADLVEDNVRELGGAFNRVIAFSTLMGRPISRDLAVEVLHAPAPEPSRGERPGGTTAVPGELKTGRSYLIEEDRPDQAYRLLATTVAGGYDGLLITRTNPKRVRERYSLGSVRVLWLTDREGSREETIAPALERIVYEIEGFMSKHSRGSVMLDGIEYLVSNNSFDAVLRFVRRLVDTVSEGHFTFLISLGPATVKPQELKMIEREMEVIRAA